jgi:hypothetical protein
MWPVYAAELHLELRESLSLGEREELRSPEQAPVDRSRQDVILNGFHDASARLESVGRWFHVEPGVQRIELKHVVVERAVCGADLKAAVRQLRALGYTFGQTGPRRRNVPKGWPKLPPSGGGRLVRGPRHRDINCHTQTLAAQEPDPTAHGNARISASACPSQNDMSISRYIEMPAVRCSWAASHLPVLRDSLPRPMWQ